MCAHVQSARRLHLIGVRCRRRGLLVGETRIFVAIGLLSHRLRFLQLLGDRLSARLSGLSWTQPLDWWGGGVLQLRLAG